jgi:hypothetical protein
MRPAVGSNVPVAERFGVIDQVLRVSTRSWRERVTAGWKNFPNFSSSSGPFFGWIGILPK